MREALHEAAPSSPVRNHCTPSGSPREALHATPRDDEQLDLSPSFHWARKGAALRELLRRAIVANGLSHADLSRDTGVDERQIARALSDDGGAHPPLPLVACVLWNDRAGVLIQGLADRLGYEVRPKSPDLAAENRQLREALANAITALQGAVR